MAFIINTDQSKAFTDFSQRLAWAKEVQARQQQVMNYQQQLYDDISDISQLQYSSDESDRALYDNNIGAYRDALDKVSKSASQGRMNYADALALRRYYSDKIKPIESARAQRQKVAEKMMGEKDSYMTQLGSVSDFMKDPTRGYTAVKGSDLDTAAKNYGNVLFNSSRPNVVGYSGDNQFVYTSQGLDFNDPRNQALVAQGADSILAERGISEANGYSASDVANARARVMQGIQQNATQTIGAQKNAGFETPSQRLNRSITYHNYQRQKEAEEAIKSGRLDQHPNAMPITNEDGSQGVVLNGQYYPRTDVQKDEQGNVIGYSNTPSYSVGANIKTGKGGIQAGQAPKSQLQDGEEQVLNGRTYRWDSTVGKNGSWVDKENPNNTMTHTSMGSSLRKGYNVGYNTSGEKFDEFVLQGSTISGEWMPSEDAIWESMSGSKAVRTLTTAEINALDKKTKERIQSVIKNYGMDLSDIDVEMKQNSIGNNYYRVKLKGESELTQETESSTPTNTPVVPATPADSTFTNYGLFNN